MGGNHDSRPMHDDSYKQLVRELAHLIGLPAQFEQLHATGGLVLKGVPAAIFPADEGTGHVHVRVEFGTLPKDRTEEVCRRLLEVNLLVSRQGNLRLALDAATSRVVLAYSYPLPGLSARQLLASIELAVQQALDWRAGYFLDAPSVPEDMRYAMPV